MNEDLITLLFAHSEHMQIILIGKGFVNPLYFISVLI